MLILRLRSAGFDARYRALMHGPATRSRVSEMPVPAAAITTSRYSSPMGAGPIPRSRSILGADPIQGPNLGRGPIPGLRPTPGPDATPAAARGSKRKRHAIPDATRGADPRQRIVVDPRARRGGPASP